MVWMHSLADTYWTAVKEGWWVNLCPSHSPLHNALNCNLLRKIHFLLAVHWVVDITSLFLERKLSKVQLVFDPCVRWLIWFTDLKQLTTDPWMIMVTTFPQQTIENLFLLPSPKSKRMRIQTLMVLPQSYSIEDT